MLDEESPAVDQFDRKGPRRDPPGKPTQKALKMIGNHRKILLPPGYSSNTHVSLLPPPCEEFTTSEPFFIATRVRPPGRMVTFSP